MKLVIAEKPQLGKAIADALPGYAETKDGVIKKRDYTIIWAYGHLLSLKEPEDFDQSYKSWSLDDLPIYFDNWGMKVKNNKVSGRVKQIGALLKDAECVIHAGDIDEEGQLLIDEILRWFSYKGPVWRLDTSNTTEAAMKKALRNLKMNDSFEADGWSAFGRELSDAVFGFNFTRYFTLKNNGVLLPVGRVQTPTLGLVVQRDLLIESHQKTFYYELFTGLSFAGNSAKAKFHPNSNNTSLTDGRFLDRNFLTQKASLLNGKHLSDIVIKKETVKQQPPLPFNLTKLTSYCAKMWNYSPDDVMKITQKLRDDYKAITYNRSDCQYLSEEHFKEAPETVRFAADNLGLSPSDFNTSIKSRCFNDANITAHFAIIPTATQVKVESLSPRERNVYTAISNYYLAQFLPSATKEQTSLCVELGNGEFLKASCSIILDPGYRKFLMEEARDSEDDESEDNSKYLSRIPAGVYSGSVTGTKIEEKETKPPARYTAASLAEDMTRVAKYISDPEIKKLLLEKDKDKKGENGSIGTAATRPGIITQLINRGYLTAKTEGRRSVLISTPKGRGFYAMLPDEIKKADVTAKWWSMQEDIKVGKVTPQQMAKDVLSVVSSVISSGVGSLNNADNFMNGSNGMVIGTCPLCGGNIVESKSSFGCTTKDCTCTFFKDNKLFASFGKTMTAAVVKSLITKGRASLRDCKSKSGSKFNCEIVVKYEGKYPSFEVEFPGFGVCPRCGSEIRKNSAGNFSCTNWKSGCTFRIYGMIAGKKLTDANVKSLLSKGYTSELSGFVSKKGEPFSAKLVLEKSGNVSFAFADHKKSR